MHKAITPRVIMGRKLLKIKPSITCMVTSLFEHAFDNLFSPSIHFRIEKTGNAELTDSFFCKIYQNQYAKYNQLTLLRHGHFESP